jgi:hypothetical protein
MQNPQQAVPANFIAPSNLFSVVQKLQNPIQDVNNGRKRNANVPADPQRFQDLLNSSTMK